MLSWIKHFIKYLHTVVDKPYFHTTIKQNEKGITIDAIFNSVFIKGLDKQYISSGRSDYSIEMDDQEKVAILLNDIIESINPNMDASLYGEEILPMHLHDKPVKTVYDLGTNKNWEVRG